MARTWSDQISVKTKHTTCFGTQRNVWSGGLLLDHVPQTVPSTPEPLGEGVPLSPDFCPWIRLTDPQTKCVCRILCASTDRWVFRGGKRGKRWQRLRAGDWLLRTSGSWKEPEQCCCLLTSQHLPRAERIPNSKVIANSVTLEIITVGQSTFWSLWIEPSNLHLHKSLYFQSLWCWRTHYFTQGYTVTGHKLTNKLTGTPRKEQQWTKHNKQQCEWTRFQRETRPNLTTPFSKIQRLRQSWVQIQENIWKREAIREIKLIKKANSPRPT